MKIAKYFILTILIISFSVAKADIDSKLRVRENGSTVSIAGSSDLSASKLHMKGANGIISILYVLPTDTWATKTIIKLADGTKMALKKFFTGMDFPNRTNLIAYYSCIGNTYTYKATTNISNTSSYDATFVLASSTTAGVSPSSFIIYAASSSPISFGVITGSHTNCSSWAAGAPVGPTGEADYNVYQNGLLVDYVRYAWGAYNNN